MATYGPWHIDITPWQHWSAASGAIDRFQSSADLGGGSARNTATSALGDWIAWDVPLTAGTWTITCIHMQTGTSPTLQFDLGGTIVGSFNANGGFTTGVVHQLTGIGVATDGVQRMTMKVIAPAPSGNLYIVHHISLDRTA